MARLCRLIAVVLILGFLLGGCDSNRSIKKDTSAEGSVNEEGKSSRYTEYNELNKKLHIVFVTPIKSNPIWLEAKKGFEDAAKEFDFRGDWVGPTVIDVNEMIKQIQIAISEKADGIITQGMNPDALAPFLKKAEEAGIPVVVVNSDIPKANRLAYLGTDPINLGTLAGSAILDKLGGKPVKAAFMVSALDYKIAQDLIRGYENALKKAPGGYQAVVMEECKSDSLTALQKWQSIFSSHPDINVAINCAGESVSPCAKVVEEMNLKGKVIIAGIDNQKDILDCIRDGSAYLTMTQNYYRKGYQASQWLVEYIGTGKKPAKLINDSGTLIVTKENVDSYSKDLRDPAKWK